MASPQYTQQLKNKKALVIGGTSGIGLGVAQALVEEGVDVIVASSTQDKVDKAVQRLTDPKQQYNGGQTRVQGKTVNLKGPEMEQSIKELFDFAGQLDFVIHTAGDSLSVSPLSDVTYEKIHTSGEVRFVSVLLTCKHAQSKLNPGGSIILTTGSISAHPIQNWSIVSGYAGGLLSLTRQLAFDLAPKIRVNCVSPGPVDTELWAGMPKEQKDAFFKHTEDNVLTAKMGTVQDVAQTYLGLLKDRNLTGETIFTDSGSKLGSRPNK